MKRERHLMRLMSVISTMSKTCPACGRKAVEVAEYDDGRVSYKHEIVEGPGGFPEVTDSCLIDNE